MQTDTPQQCNSSHKEISTFYSNVPTDKFLSNNKMALNSLTTI